MRVFDGHNDILTTIYARGIDAFLKGGGSTHIDLPRARDAGFSGGLFAVMAPADPFARARPTTSESPIESVSHEFAHRFTTSVLAMALRLARTRHDLHIVRSAGELEGEGLRVVLHLEGAEPIDPRLNALEVFYAAGVRSIGLVWSRPNAFGHGVPFRFPSTPDTGPGLTGAGLDLIAACNDLGVVIDLSHLNERGFWDVAEASTAPLVASHSNAHALCAHSRNLTDAQLDAVAASEGIAGVNFAMDFLSSDGPGTQASSDHIVRHTVYLAERMGAEHVGLGSDFDGATIPEDLGSVAGLPALVDRLRDEFTEAELAGICRANWHRVLTEIWS